MSKISTKKLVLIALCSAILTAGKYVLSAVPNIEIVTLFILLYATFFKRSESLTITLIFITCEIFIYGINTWLISYYIYWSLLTIVGGVLKKIKWRFYLAPIIGVIMTCLFGVITSLVDTGLFTGFFNNFWQRFAILYVRGVPFFILHIVSNAIAISILYPILYKILLPLFAKYNHKNNLPNSNIYFNQ